MDAILETLFELHLPVEEPQRGWYVIGALILAAVAILSRLAWEWALSGRVKALERRLDPFAADPAALEMGVRAPEVP